MDTLSPLWEQNTHADKGGHAAAQFPLVLPQMSTRNHYKCTTIQINNHQRARRTDAEPMNLWEFPIVHRLFIYEPVTDQKRK